MLATIIGRIPKILFDGFHFVPIRNFSGPIFPIAGIPFANRNAQIRNTASTEVQAAIRNTPFIAFSLKWFIHYTFLSLYQKSRWYLFYSCKRSLLTKQFQVTVHSILSNNSSTMISNIQTARLFYFIHRRTALKPLSLSG